jgi:alkylation response protein AidB-like acyl-CoA dehydrogenase
MEFSVTREQMTLRNEIVSFAQRELNEGLRQREQTGQFERCLWQKCAEQKLQSLAAPREFGGNGLDSLSTAMALEAFGYGCMDGGLVFGIAAHLLAVVVPIWKHGSDEQRREYLPRLCDGSWIGANAMTEPGSGSDVASITTDAVPEANGFRLTGVKTLITNASVADLAVVFAVTDHAKGFHGGLTAFLVETSSRGVVRPPAIRMMSVQTCSVGDLHLDGVFVPSSAVLGGIGGGSAVFSTAMNWERTCLFAAHVGGIERLLESTLKRARTRRQSGQAIGKFQSVSNRVADMKVCLEAARLLVYQAAWRLERSKTVAMDASIAKLFTSESLLKVAVDAVRIFGGSGLFDDGEVERELRNAMATTLYSGTSDIQRNIIARWLGL